MLPGAVVYVFAGTTISNIADAVDGNYDGGYIYIIMLVIGTLLGIFAVVYVSVVTKRYLQSNMIDIEGEADEEYVEQNDEAENQEMAMRSDNEIK